MQITLVFNLDHFTLVTEKMKESKYLSLFSALLNLEFFFSEGSARIEHVTPSLDWKSNDWDWLPVWFPWSKALTFHWNSFRGESLWCFRHCRCESVVCVSPKNHKVDKNLQLRMRGRHGASFWTKPLQCAADLWIGDGCSDCYTFRILTRATTTSANASCWWLKNWHTQNWAKSALNKCKA